MGRNLCDSVKRTFHLSALEVPDGVRPQPDMAVQMNFFEGLKECIDENQRETTKIFEDELSALAIAAAPNLESLASTKPAGGPGKDKRKTADVAGRRRPKQVVIPLCSLVVSRGRWQMLSFREFFRPKPYLDAFTGGTMVLRKFWFEIVKSIAH